MHRAASADDLFFSRLFVEAMKWQWTDEPISTSDPLKKLLFNMCVGITALFVFLHTQAQTRALMLGATTLKLEHYVHVYRHGLRPLRRVLHAIRTSQPHQPKEIEEFLKAVSVPQPGG